MAANPRRPKISRAGRRQGASRPASGLDGSAAESPGPVGNQIRSVPLSAIVVPPRRIRRDLGDIDALALSLHMHGQLAPVIVHQVGERYHLIAGERRLEATRRLHAAQVRSGQLTPDAPATIDVIVRELLAGESPREVELAENAQRRELSDVEEADALITLVRQDGRDMSEVAGIAGRSVGYVSKRVRMFEDSTLRAALLDGTLTPAQAEELLTLDDDRRAQMLQLVVAEGWSSKQVREAVQALLRASRDSSETPDPALEVEDFDTEYGDDEAMPSLDTTLNVDDAGLQIIRDRPPGLAKRILELNAILQDLRPFQLQKADDRALRLLWMTLRQLAQAPRLPQRTHFPSLSDAETLARRRSAQPAGGRR